MPACTSNEKRQIIVNLIKQRILSHEQIAEVVEVSHRTVYEIWYLYEKTNSIKPKPRGGGNPGWFLDSDYPLLERLVKEKNDATLAELATMFEKETGDRPAITTLHNALAKLNITRKKKRNMQVNKTEKT